MCLFGCSSLIDQFLGGTFDVEMKCTETDDEEPTFSNENFLQLSCFISQDVKYMLSGIKSVCVCGANSVKFKIPNEF